MDDASFHQQLLATFAGEAREHWQALAAGLLELERGGERSRQLDVVETLFREAHTLKGAARLVRRQSVEALCARLEDVFSELKHARAVPGAEEVEELQREIAELQQMLGLGLGAATAVVEAAPPPVETDAADESPVAPMVRVPAQRLDALLLQAEELLALKSLQSQRAETLMSRRREAAAWRTRWQRLKPQLALLRRHLDLGGAGAMQRPLTELLQFLEWNEEHAATVRRHFRRSARVAAREQSWTTGVVDQLLEETKEILVLPCASLLQLFPSFVRETARAQGKEVEVILVGAATQVDRRVLDDLRDAVTHLVRNSIDHGMETPTERELAGKPAGGRLTLAVEERTGGSVEVRVADDGRGVNVAAVRARAVERGLIPAAEAPAWEDDEVLALLFRSGFSTRATVNDLSGRGLGLAIVKEKVERLGGTIAVETIRGQGTTFRLIVPVTLARFRALLLQAANRPFAVAATYVREVVRVRPEAVRRVKQQDTLAWRGQTLPLLPLARILQLPEDPHQATPGRFAVVLGTGQAQVACRVDTIPFESEIVMKSLGGLLRRVRFVAGATIVGAGQVVPVLNASDLVLAAHERAVPVAVWVISSPAAPPRAGRILIAEDSITSRTLFRTILQGAGYDVRTAVDGVEAMTALKYEPVDLVISDVQMPRMDGLELTRRIRAEPTLATLPVILITSLASREDKERGVDAGANAYVVKSSFDQSDLLQSIRRLLG